MIKPQPGRPHARPPVVAAPPPFVERRKTFRRAADRLAHRETTLLARSLDVLASDAPAEARLGGLLELLARTAGAARAAVVAESGGERRVAVGRAGQQDEEAAIALGRWLDDRAPRPRAHRAAAGQASVLVVDSGVADRALRQESGAMPAYACLPIPSAGDVALGFEFEAEITPDELADRLPPQLARHAAVALALVTDQLARERELSALRAHEVERDRFVSTVAHELRTPLTGLSGYLQLILDGQVADPADERDFLERSRQIVESMADLVGDLLELSRLESGTLQLEIAPFSLAEIGTRVADGVAAIAMSRGVKVVTSLPPRLRAARGDRRRVEQIVTNLLANALKFAPAGSTAEVAAWFEGPIAAVAVRDEGAGIPAEDRERIFQRFHRLPGHERITGTGLGLPIARDLAFAMDGALGVASIEGSGCSFVLVLPGPAGATQSQVEAALGSALADEERRIEERAAVRALASAAPRPRLVPAGGSLVKAAGGRPQLRAIEGRGARNSDATPA